MQPYCVEPARFRIDIAVDDVGRKDMSRVWIRVSEEVCQCDGGKSVLIAEVALVELHHAADLRYWYLAISMVFTQSLHIESAEK